jgi:RHS repeat-associated protein
LKLAFQAVTNEDASYSFTAIATDNSGATTTSAAVSVRVNAAPTVSITAPASIAISAAAADTDGTIVSVAFYQNGSLITTLTAPPYSITWTGVPQGSYSLTAVASDDLGATTTSAPVSITVSSGVAQMYFIHPDHLNTPWAVTDASGTIVWRWDQTEPFGDSVPNGDPSGVGAFEFNLRFPGQYADRESGLSYNYFRDYDPIAGRYVESDPIGLRGGLNTYVYGLDDPLTGMDPSGLDVVVTYYPGGPGHVGIGVNTNQTVGLYPILHSIPMATCSTVSGAILSDQTFQPQKVRNAASSLIIKTEPWQDLLMQRYIDRVRNGGYPSYNLCAYQCQSFVDGVLTAGGVARPPSPGIASFPASYYDALQDMYGGQRRK